MGRVRAALAIGVVAAVASGGCGFDGGGLEAVGDDASGPGDDATADVTPTDGNGGKDAPHDSRAGADGGDARAQDASADGPPSDAGCDAGAVEVCNNGVDDNCDGKIDCADPTCTTAGWSCITAPPVNWAYVGYIPSMTSCPQPFGAPLTMQQDPISTQADCTCSCTVGSPPSTCDKFGILDCDHAILYVPYGGNNGACTAQNISLNSGHMAVSGYADDGTCTANPAGAYQFGSTAVTICQGPSLGGGCGGGQQCAPPVAGGSECVWQPGQGGSCPAGYQVHSYEVGTSVDDTRSCACGACSGPAVDACNMADLKLWRSGNCGGGPDWQGGELQCQAYNGPYAHYEYTGGTVSGNPTCMYSSSQGSTLGTLSLASPYTVCCEN